MSIVVPVCGGVVCDPCVGVGGGVEVGKIVDVELPSGKPAGEQYNSEDLYMLVRCEHEIHDTHQSLQLLVAHTVGPLLLMVKQR